MITIETISGSTAVTVAGGTFNMGTVPAGKQWIVKSLSVQNTDASADLVGVAISVNGRDITGVNSATPNLTIQSDGALHQFVDIVDQISGINNHNVPIIFLKSADTLDIVVNSATAAVTDMEWYASIIERDNP